MCTSHYIKYCHPFFGHQRLWQRRFLTTEEKKELKERSKKKKIKWMKHYKESLEQELMGVNEKSEKLKKERS